MMNEEGVVKSIIGKKAKVLARRSTMCESCDHKSSCMTITSNRDVEIEALNTAEARIGDRVMVSMETSSILKITTLVYLFPVIGLIGGIFIGHNFGKRHSYDPELTSLLSGVILFIITFIIIKIMAGRMGKQKKYMPEITRILPGISETDEENCDTPSL